MRCAELAGRVMGTKVAEEHLDLRGGTWHALELVALFAQIVWECEGKRLAAGDDDAFAFQRSYVWAYRTYHG